MLLQNQKKKECGSIGLSNLDLNMEQAVSFHWKFGQEFVEQNFSRFKFWSFLGHFICGYFNYANKFFVWKFPNLKNQMFSIHKNGSPSCAVHISFVKITFRSKNLTKNMKKSVVHDFCGFWLGIFPIFIFKWDISFLKKRAKTIPLR